MAAPRAWKGRPGFSVNISPATVLVAIVALLGFVVALQVSIAGAFRSDQPQISLAWAPFDAAAREELASDITSFDPSPSTREIADGLARDALRRSPLSPVAMRVLGSITDAEERASDAHAAELFLEAQRLTRRDLPTQLWLIEHYLRRGDIPAAMRGFDIALRTSYSSRRTIFPLLGAAAADPTFNAALRARLREEPDWAYLFATYLALEGADPEQAVELTQVILDPADPDDLKVIRGLLQRLAQLEEYALAWRAYSGFGLAKNQSRAGSGLVDGDFEGSEGFAPFAWVLTDEGDLFSARQRATDGDGYALRLVAFSGRTGEVARQVVRLPVGNYRLQARVGDVPADAFERPEVRVRCVNGGDQEMLLSVKPDSGGTSAQDVEGRFSVPRGCDFQEIAIAVAGDGPQDGDAPWIDDIRLTPVGG